MPSRVKTFLCWGVKKYTYRANYFNFGLGLAESKGTFGPGHRFALYWVSFWKFQTKYDCFFFSHEMVDSLYKHVFTGKEQGVTCQRGCKPLTCTKMNQSLANWCAAFWCHEQIMMIFDEQGRESSSGQFWLTALSHRMTRLQFSLSLCLPGAACCLPLVICSFHVWMTKRVITVPTVCR